MRHGRTRMSCCVLTIFTAIAGCSGAEPSAPASSSSESISRSSAGVDTSEPVDRTVRLALVEPPGLLPVENLGWQTGVLTMIYSPLVAVSPEGRLEPVVAATLPTTDDARTWTVEIAPGWTFHTGEPVTAESFVQTWSYRDDREFSSYSWAFAGILGYQEFADGEADAISGFQVVGESSVAITLVEPNSLFPYVLAQPDFLPVAPSCLADPAGCRWQPSGNGPFRLAEAWSSGERLVLEPYEAWGGGVPPDVYRVEVVFDATGPTGVADIATGELDLISISGGTTVPAEQSGGLRVMADNVAKYLGFPTWDERFTADVRDAIGMAIDRQSIIDEVYAGNAVEMDALFPEGTAGYRSGVCGRACEYDPAGARSLLEAVGGINGDPLVLRVSEDDAETRAFRMIADQLIENLGLAVEVEVVDRYATFFGGLQRRPGQLAQVGWTGDHAIAHDYLALWTGDRARDLHYASAELGQLVTEAKIATTVEDGLALVARAEDAILADRPVVPLWSRASRYLVGGRLADLPFDGLGTPMWTELAVS